VKTWTREIERREREALRLRGKPWSQCREARKYDMEKMERTNPSSPRLTGFIS
jgi:hypothetical protein